MASAINKITRQYLSRGVARDAILGSDWIINPTQDQINDIRKPTIDELKDTMIAQANAECQANINDGFEFEGDVYQSEEKDQLNYNSLVSKKNKLPSSFRMTLKNGNFKSVQTSKLDNLTDAAFFHKMNALEAYKDKVELIRQASTIEELDAL